MDNCNSTKVPLLNTLTYLKDPCIATSEDGHIGMHRRGGIGDRIKMVSTDTVWYCPDPSQHSSNESARLRTPHYGSMEGNRGRSSLGAQEAVPPIVAEPGISSTDATNNTAGLWPLVTRRQHCQLANPVLLRPPSPTMVVVPQTQQGQSPPCSLTSQFTSNHTPPPVTPEALVV